jgi:hypothetical protein
MSLRNPNLKKHPLGKEKPPGPKGILPLPKYSSKNFS